MTFGLLLGGWSCHQAIQRHPAARAGSANALLPSNGMKQSAGCVKGMKGNSAKKWSFHLFKVCLWHVSAKTSLIHCLPARGLKLMCSWYAFGLWWGFFCWLDCFSYLFYFKTSDIWGSHGREQIPYRMISAVLEKYNTNSCPRAILAAGASGVFRVGAMICWVTITTGFLLQRDGGIFGWGIVSIVLLIN